MFCNPTLGICNLVVENIQIVVVCQKNDLQKQVVFFFVQTTRIQSIG